MKKGQGALEFLMTYGWAFLVILIMIGALAYFGVLNPSKFLPERCTFGAQMLCKDHLIKYDGSTDYDVTVKLQNNIGNPIRVLDSSDVLNVEGFSCSTYNLYESDGTTPMTFDSGGGAADGDTIADGATFVFKGNDCTGGGVAAGAKYKADVNVQYYVATSSDSFSHTLSGEVFTNVEE